MTLAEQPSHLREALATHEALLRLGYTPDEIHFAVAGPDDRVQVMVVLRAQGLEFTIIIEMKPVRQSRKAIVAAWTAAIMLWNGPIPEDDRDALYRTSWIYKNGVRLVLALRAKGFINPTTRAAAPLN